MDSHLDFRSRCELIRYPRLWVEGIRVVRQAVPSLRGLETDPAKRVANTSGTVPIGSL